MRGLDFMASLSAYFASIPENYLLLHLTADLQFTITFKRSFLKVSWGAFLIRDQISLPR